MLHIYTGRENIHKEKAMFERIDTSSRTYLLVPDQYTLQMERNAIDFYEAEGLMNLEVLSFSRLTARVLSETGGSRQKVIDKNGRHMLLSRIILQEQENLKAFGGMVRSHSFIDMMNNLIAEIKQHNSSAEDIEEALSCTGESSILRRKLEDLLLIFTKYEEAIRGKFIDTESYLDFFISRIGKSRLVKEGTFWISGFDSLTPKAMEIIKELSRHGESVHMMLAYEKGSKIFQLTEATIGNLEKVLGPSGVKLCELSGPLAERPRAVSHLERNLFDYPFEAAEEEAKELTLLNAANFYNEAESAASYILDLVREKGLRYRDIAVICNDMDERAAIIKRVFDEYGISHFIDKKHQVFHNPAVAFITALLDAAASNGGYEDIFRLVKTGFTPLNEDAAEALENYCIKYRIKGNRWEKDFKYGKEEYGEEGLAELNEYRKVLWNFLNSYFRENVKAKTVKEKTRALVGFLKEELEMEAALEGLCRELEDQMQLEEAMEIGQIWDDTMDLTEQLNELLGDETVDYEDFSKIIKSGFDSMELGLIPTTMDQVVVGTMQRTRTGDIKALLVLGANDGILPAETGKEDLLSRDEKKFLQNQDILFCRDDDLKIMEENLAIYKQMSRAERYLWISYSTANLEGKEIRPSVIFNKMRKIFPKNPVVKDIVNSGDSKALLSGKDSSLKYMIRAMEKHYREGEESDSLWQSAYGWYKENDKERMELIESGFTFDNRAEKLSLEAMKNLFGMEDGKKMRLSPTRLERYSKCPFAHLVRYGFKPEEKRIFQVAGREVGDVYHHCLMLFAKNLTVDGLPLQHENSPWTKVTEEEIEEMISGYMKELAETYREGVLGSGKEEKYRLERMELVCKRAASALVEHVRQGRIEKVFFEESFSSKEGSLIPAISVKVGDKEYLIEGVIDRIDILPGDYAKIIDYKSGKERFNPKEAVGGWRLQLMLYLKVVREGMEAAKPGGVFYFEIADLMVDSEEQDEEALALALEKEMRKRFRLDGVVLNDEKVIESIAGEFSGYSDILPIMKKKDGTYSSKAEGKLLSEEEFEELEQAMDKVIKELCYSLSSGLIEIKPKKLKDISACTYCDYKSICNFDLFFDGCSYDMVKS